MYALSPAPTQRTSVPEGLEGTPTVGVTVTVFEAEAEGGMRYGFTDNYIKVAVLDHEEMWNTIQTISLNEISDFGYIKGTKHLEYSLA